ncbi:hypothetical protein V1291_000036 [Nitrobacteraceae bacterium AZCC 1564]
MPRIEVQIPGEMLDKLNLLAKDNGRSIRSEITQRLASTLTRAERARRAKVAIVAVNLVEAKAYAKRCSYRRDEWFYATSVDAVQGRYVRRIEFVGDYTKRKDLTPLLRDLRGGELAYLVDCR